MNAAPAILTMRDDILAQLQGQLQASSDPDVQQFGYAVDKFPGDPRTYKPTSPIGGILVFYKGSKRSDPMASSPKILQQRLVDFEVTVLSIDLLSQDTATKVIDAIDQALTGYRPTWSDRSLWISKDGFVANKGGLWQYGILCHAKLLSLQQGNP